MPFLVLVATVARRWFEGSAPRSGERSYVILKKAIVQRSTHYSGSGRGDES